MLGYGLCTGYLKYILETTMGCDDDDGYDRVVREMFDGHGVHARTRSVHTSHRIGQWMT